MKEDGGKEERRMEERMLSFLLSSLNSFLL